MLLVCRRKRPRVEVEEYDSVSSDEGEGSTSSQRPTKRTRFHEGLYSEESEVEDLDLLLQQ